VAEGDSVALADGSGCTGSASGSGAVVVDPTWPAVELEWPTGYSGRFLLWNLWVLYNFMVFCGF
jgi:hypothetical protein